MTTKNLTRIGWTALSGALIAAGCAAPDRFVGMTAPDFKLAGLNGKDVALSQHKGDVVLLAFWAVG